MSNRTPFAEHLRAYRKGLDLTQAELAERCGYSRSTIRKVETGELKPSRGLARALARALELDDAVSADFVRDARVGGAIIGSVSTPDNTGNRSVRGLIPPTTAFIGRQRERAEVGALLVRPEVRLLNLCGLGGIGKTRLAIAVAEAFVGDRDHDCVFVSLAAVPDPSQVPAAIARAMGVDEAGIDRLEQHVRAAVAAGTLLLVLDAFDPPLGANAFVEHLLEAAPELRVLVTSRLRLPIAAAYHYNLAPLGHPANRDRDGETLRSSEAVELFVDRARAAGADYVATDAMLPAVAALCHQLDGLPLAIELAAARMPLLSPHELLSRLDERLSLLTRQPQVELDQLRSLRGLLAVSYGLQSPSGRVVLARLSCCAPGFDLAAVEAICTAAGTTDDSTIDVLTELIDHGLVQRRYETDEPRFELSRTVRAFARELLATDEHARLAHRHATYYLERCTQLETALAGAEQHALLARLELDHANLRQALEWSLVHEPAIAGQLVAAVWRFWLLRGYVSEGRQWVEKALHAGFPRSARDTVAVRARLLNAAGVLALRQSANTEAHSYLTQSLELWRTLDDASQCVGILNNLAVVALNQGDRTAARAAWQDCLGFRHSVQDPRGVAQIWSNLGYLALQECAYPTAAGHFEQALTRWRVLADHANIAFVLLNLGRVAMFQGRLLEAERQFDESLAESEQLGDPRGRAFALLNLGTLELRRGRVSEAVRYLEQSATLAGGIDDRWCSALTLGGLGTAAHLARRYEHARRLAVAYMDAAYGLGDAWCIADALLLRGTLATESNQVGRAARWLTEAVVGFAACHDHEAGARTLLALATIAARQERGVLAVRLLGAADAIRTSIGAVWSTVGREAVNSLSLRLANLVGEHARRDLLDEGRRWSIGDAIAALIADDSNPHDVSKTQEPVTTDTIPMMPSA